MSIRRLLEDLDALEMDDNIDIEDDFGIIPEIEECVLAYDDEGNLVSEHVSANEFVVEYGISQDELEALIKESGEPLRLFKVAPEGADDYALYIGNEACTAEDVKNRLISNLGDEEMDFEVAEIKDEDEPKDKDEPDAEIPTEEQLREGWDDGKGYVYYCISDGMNPRK